MTRKKFMDQFRAAIETSGVSRYRLWKETGISQATLSRFMSGKGGMSLEALDKLADVLKLEITRREK